MERDYDPVDDLQRWPPEECEPCYDPDPGYDLETREIRPEATAPAPSKRYGGWFRVFSEMIQSIEYRRLPDATARTYIELCAYVCAGVSKSKPFKFSNGEVPHWRDFRYVTGISQKAAKKQYEELVNAGFLTLVVESEVAESYLLTEWVARQYTNNSSARSVAYRAGKG